MTPLPATEDAPDSPLSPPAPERTSFESRDPGDVAGSSRSELDNREVTPAAASISTLTASRESQLNRESEPFNVARTPSPAYAKSPGDDLRETILASFAPRVALLASEDTDDIAAEKGFTNGFYDLLRPFSEQISGKVIVRNSFGANKAWENFGLRLLQYGQDPTRGRTFTGQGESRSRDDSQAMGELNLRSSSSAAAYERKDPIDAILEVSLLSLRPPSQISIGDLDNHGNDTHHPGNSSSTYTLYLRKLLSGTSQAPYETFTHPVACIIAVSSRSQGPLEKIRQLYSMSGHANAKIPPWVGVDYLRYYVLVHDEDRDDVTKSTALFDLMKRHFGLHCYLLRIRSVSCAETDDDSVRMPQCIWTSAAEEQQALEESTFDGGWRGNYVFDSDVTAIRSFMREMVTQSIVPYMEGRIATWNDQVASKRRGIGGRFMSLSKKWAGFGSSRGSNPSMNTATNSTSGNYDPGRGYYLPEVPEAIMRQLADYAFMLRDFKLAFSTYESLRTDFSNDKAWFYHASASELAGISYLLIPQTLSNRSRSEMVDQKLDAALYSYLARCRTPVGALRALILTIELLMGKGSAAADDAVKWAIRLLDLAILTPLQQALITERVADIHQLQTGSGLLGLGSRTRHTQLWRRLASALWAELGRPVQVEPGLSEALTVAEDLSHATNDPSSPEIDSFFKFPAQERSEPRDKAIIQPDSITFDTHGNRTRYEPNERLDQRFTPAEPEPEPGPTDFGGFSTIDANHINFEDA
ncbi:MAG: hypothetical protein Q9170_001203 [Blastenia crenularia]